GSYVIRLLTTGSDGQSRGAASLTVQILTIEQQGANLLVGTGNTDDSIVFTPGAKAGTIQVTVNGASAGMFTTRAPIHIDGNGGTDRVTINGTARADAFFVNGSTVSFSTFTFVGDEIENWQINGLGGIDTLHGANSANNWTITGASQGSLGNVNFSTIE